MGIYHLIPNICGVRCRQWKAIRRVTVASNVDNTIDANCSFTAGATIVLSIELFIVVNADKLVLKGKIVNNDGQQQIELLNHSGQKIRSRTMTARIGSYNVVIGNIDNPASGFYILRLSSDKSILYHKLIKSNY